MLAWRFLLTTAGAARPARVQPLSLSQRERFALILKAVDGSAGQCPACALWALELGEAAEATAPQTWEKKPSC